MSCDTDVRLLLVTGRVLEVKHPCGYRGAWHLIVVLTLLSRPRHCTQTDSNNNTTTRTILRRRARGRGPLNVNVHTRDSRKRLHAERSIRFILFTKHTIFFPPYCMLLCFFTPMYENYLLYIICYVNILCFNNS